MRVALVYFNNQGIASQGVGYIGSAVLEAGHDLDFVDTFYDSTDSVVLGDYDVVLMSATTLFYPQAKQLAREIKQHSSRPQVVLGGIHATIAKGAILKECYDIDHICVGEGEAFVVEFLRVGYGNLRSLANFGYRWRIGESIVNDVRPCQALDDLPSFRHDLFNPRSIVQDSPWPGFCYVYASRGCPYRCSYCGNGVYLDLYRRNYLRTRSADSIIAELRFLKENYPVKFFYFGDEMVLSREEFVADLFRRVKEEIGLPYGCMARVEHITPTLVDLFRETGCGYVGVGVECGDEEFRREFLNRRMSNKQIIDAFAALHTIPGMKTTAFTMTGWPVPYDARLDQATKDLIAILKPTFRQKNTFYPFPGTTLYDYCVENDLIDWEKWKGVENLTAESVLRI